MPVHNFDETVDRRGTDCKKYSESVFPRDVLPMWIADTDFKCPYPVTEAVINRMKEGIYGYPIVSSELKNAVANWERKRFGWEIDTDMVEFVPGVIPGIICAMRALSIPGDYVVVQSPCYPPFSDAILHNGRHILRNELLNIHDKYEIDFNDLEKKLSNPRTKLMILCNPQNPTGRVFSLTELKKIGELCLKHNVIILSDEIHCDIVYRGYRHIPFASINKDFAEHSVTFVSPSKTFNVAGFRTAAFICPNSRIKNMVHESVLDNKGVGENLAGTVAMTVAYNQCDYYADQLIGYLEKNLEIVTDSLEGNEKIKFIKPEGTYLLWLDCRGLKKSQDLLVRFFVENAKLGLNDGTTFGNSGEGFMRMNIATQRSKVILAMESLTKALFNV